MAHPNTPQSKASRKHCIFLAYVTIVTTLNHPTPSAVFAFAPQRTYKSIENRKVASRISSCNAFELWAQNKDSKDVIFYDDFGDAVGSGGFIGDASQSSIAYAPPLPDFDEQSASSVGSTSDSKYININDLTGSNVRQFSLGSDLLISDYVGSLGYDEVTEWMYYLQSVDEEGNIDSYDEKIPVQAPFMDPSKPSRTRTKSGSVVRIFRGEFTGRLGGLLRSNGMDNRVLIKEYSVDSVELVTNEKEGIGRLMSAWFSSLFLNQDKSDLLEKMQAGRWIEAAASRYIDSITDTKSNEDDNHLQTLLSSTSKQKAPFTSLLGEMNLNNYYDDPDLDPNEWYRSLGVKPPSPGSTLLVYDYHGLSTAGSYCEPLIFQQSKLPPKRGVFGRIIPPPPLPPFKERARYMVQGVMKQMLVVLAETHEAGLLHNSIGRNSFILSSVGQDKREATNPYSVVVDRLRVILSDWGFSQSITDVFYDESFTRRAESFGIDIDYDPEAVMEFAKAEDLHSLGFVFLSLFFTTLAEPTTLSAPMPPTDDETWLRLFSDLFNKDMDEFREYCTNEDVWDSVVNLLDMEDGAGWNVLSHLLLARERVSERSKGKMEVGYELTTARTLLSSRFFQMRII
eukprot:scaffold31833_cov68-Cyclotella_meneghiniana.AAC.1